MLITSREYKVIVDESLLKDPSSGLRDILDDVEVLARSLGVKLNGDFDPQDPRVRTLLFLDTSEFAVRQNGLLLRKRVERKNGKTKYTLKCRTEDRYIAGGRTLRTTIPGELKFEEDVGVPFVSRFSQSATITLDKDAALAGQNHPRTLKEASGLFPDLRDLTRDGVPCGLELPLAPVNGQEVIERVFVGPELGLGKTPLGGPATATLSVIVWSKRREDRLVTAEFSFRYEDDREEYLPGTALVARRFFQAVQRQEWARPESLTKTQFLYGE
jgi:hypothetical protein